LQRSLLRGNEHASPYHTPLNATALTIRSRSSSGRFRPSPYTRSCAAIARLLSCIQNLHSSAERMLSWLEGACHCQAHLPDPRRRERAVLAEQIGCRDSGVVFSHIPLCLGPSVVWVDCSRSRDRVSSAKSRHSPRCHSWHQRSTRALAAAFDRIDPNQQLIYATYSSIRRSRFEVSRKHFIRQRPTTKRCARRTGARLRIALGGSLPGSSSTLREDRSDSVPLSCRRDRDRRPGGP